MVAPADADLFRRDLDADGLAAWSPADPGWSWALECARWASGGSPARRPPTEGDPRGLVRGAWVLARGALVAMDRDLLGGWVAYAEGVGVEPGIVALLRSFRAHAGGEDPQALVYATEASESAKGAAPALRVEAETMRALALLADRRGDEARDVARRAARMGRTESLPQSEYLAGLVLARLRRWEGRPHHAARILSALAAIVPEPWRGWVALELWLAGEVGGAAEVRAETSTPAGAVVTRWLEHGALTSPSTFAPLARLEHEVEALLDPRAPAPESVAAWRGGGPLPLRVRGLALVGDEDEPLGAPWILAGESSAARLLALGLGRFDAPRLRAPRRQRRTTQAIAALALSGAAGLPREVLFERVYGFPFKAVTHQGSLDTLMHRVREVIGDHGELRRDGGSVSLVLRGPVLIEDEAGDTPLEELVLRSIAANPGTSARELASSLGVALRTMQTLLTGLAEQGLCDAIKDGRRLVYKLEDTTFSEPTRAGVASPPSR